MTSVDQLFSPEVEQDLDAAWEAIHEYDRYSVDTAILNNWRDIEDTSSTHPYSLTSDWSSERWDRAKSLTTLLHLRFKELVSTGEWIEGEYGYENSVRKEHKAVLTAWQRRYFLHRVETATLAQYNDFILARAQFAGLNEDRIRYRDSDAQFNFGRRYRVLSDITMVPLYGVQAVNIIVPPHIEVKGELGHSKLYRWSEVELPSEDFADLYPSTRALLVAKAGLERHRELPVEAAMSDKERELMNGCELT